MTTPYDEIATKILLEMGVTPWAYFMDDKPLVGSPKRVHELHKDISKALSNAHAQGVAEVMKKSPSEEVFQNEIHRMKEDFTQSESNISFLNGFKSGARWAISKITEK